MKKLLLIGLLLVLAFPVLAQNNPCVETWISFHDGETPCYQWDIPPCWPPVFDKDYLEWSPNEMGQCGCELGVSAYDQVWNGPNPLSHILYFQIYRACLVSSSQPFYVYVAYDSTASGHQILDLTDYNGFDSYCSWSDLWTIDLNDVEGFDYVSGKPYYIRIFCGSNSHSICAMCFFIDETIGVESTSWGAIKQFYR